MKIELLTREHVLTAFECRSEVLTIWLKRFALTNQQNSSCRTFVAVQGGIVIGFYALAAGSVAKSVASRRVGQGLANHPVPVAILTRLAVHQHFEGKRVGSYLFRDALLRLVAASETLGIRALLVHAKDDGARRWYEERFGLERSPVDPYQLFLLMKDVKASIGS